ESFGSFLQRKSIVAKNGTAEPGDESNQPQGCERKEDANRLRGEPERLQPITRPGQPIHPGFRIPRFERQKKVELLGRTRQDGKDDQREFEQPKRQQSPVIHREQDAASTLARNSLCFGSIGLATFTGAYRF